MLEPLIGLDTVLLATSDLCADVCAQLVRRGEGLQRARLLLFRPSGTARSVEIATSRAEQSPAALLRLFRERLNIAPETIDAEFGVEMMRLEAEELARIAYAPQPLTADNVEAADEARIDALIDALVARLGADRIVRPAVRDAHAPERAAGWRSALRTKINPDKAILPPDDGVMRRPICLFSPPQPIEAIATVPDGPPVRFRWRRVVRSVEKAEGPERISENWLIASDQKTRDYYRVEDTRGRRYWLFREGFYGGGSARWFIHGLFS